jgi:hypothetical protein
VTGMAADDLARWDIRFRQLPEIPASLRWFDAGTATISINGPPAGIGLDGEALSHTDQ